MTEKAVKPKTETVPDLDDLLQCPVCYEIPTGQIFQCNEGHHVCGRCKKRLDVCPVCRAFFFGTRNYAMEELIASIHKLRAFKLGGKVTTGSIEPDQQNEAKESTSTSEENDSANNDEEEEASSGSVSRTVGPPRPCSGLFRCLCCKTNPERLPSARLLNHLRYFHSPDLIEGRSDENGEYIQAWQFSTNIGRIVTAIRIGDMGLFFLVIEITVDSIYSWLVMAASPQVAEEFNYTYTLTGNDREAIYCDMVWSVRTCEGSLKKRMRCLAVTGSDARALLTPNTMSAKLRLRRTPLDQPPNQLQPRAVLRVANRSARSEAAPAPPPDVTQELEPFLQDLQNDVARLSRAFATLGREATALVRSEAEMRARLEHAQPPRPEPAAAAAAPAPASAPQAAAPAPASPPPEFAPLSRNARRRMRQRLRQAFSENILRETTTNPAPVVNPARQTIRLSPHENGNSGARTEPTTFTVDRSNQTMAPSVLSSNRSAFSAARTENNQIDRANNNQQMENTTQANSRARSPVHVFSGFALLMDPPVAPPPVLPPAAGPATNGTAGRNKKKRRQRR